MIQETGFEHKRRFEITLTDEGWGVLDASAKRTGVCREALAVLLLEAGAFSLRPVREGNPGEQTRLKQDGTVDGRTLVKTRPRRNTVKREAISVNGPVIKSGNRNAVGQYKIWLSCDHVVLKAASNGPAPEVGKFYACRLCSQAADG